MGGRKRKTVAERGHGSVDYKRYGRCVGGPMSGGRGGYKDFWEGRSVYL